MKNITRVFFGLTILACGSKWIYAQYIQQAGAATAGESYARGMSDVVQAAGYANLQNSMAAQNYAKARSMEMDNRLQYTQTYFQNKQINQQYTEAQLAKNRPTSEQLFRLAHQEAPKSLTSQEIDLVSGDINWPAALLDPAFDTYRSKAEQYFKLRASGSWQCNHETLMRVRQVTSDWNALLKSKIREYTGTEYAKAKNFIESLSFEAQKS